MACGATITLKPPPQDPSPRCGSPAGEASAIRGRRQRRPLHVEVAQLLIEDHGYGSSRSPAAPRPVGRSAPSGHEARRPRAGRQCRGHRRADADLAGGGACAAVASRMRANLASPPNAFSSRFCLYAFLDAFIPRVKQLQVGDGSTTRPTSAMISLDAAERVERWIVRRRRAAPRLPGRQADRQFLEPTVLLHTSPR